MGVGLLALLVTLDGDDDHVVNGEVNAGTVGDGDCDCDDGEAEEGKDFDVQRSLSFFLRGASRFCLRDILSICRTVLWSFEDDKASTDQS